MHLTMIVIFMLSVICGQFIIVCWKARHSRSYQVCHSVLTYTVIVTMDEQYQRLLACVDYILCQC